MKFVRVVVGQEEATREEPVPHPPRPQPRTLEAARCSEVRRRRQAPRVKPLSIRPLHPVPGNHSPPRFDHPLTKRRSPRRFPVMNTPCLSFVCPLRWEQLDGPGPVRHCARCAQPVHDLSELGPVATATLLARAFTEPLCVRFRCSTAGKILFGGALVVGLAG